MADPSTPTTSKIITPSHARHLAHTNLLSIFSQRNPTTRLTTIGSTYTPTATIHEPNATTISGHETINDTVSTLLASREGWDFVTLSPVKLNHDFVYLAWGFGPRTSGEFGSGEKEGVEVKITGSDHFLVDAESGLIQKLYVIIDGVADVKI